MYQICCGLGRALGAADRAKVDTFNSPGFKLFHDTLDTCMEELKATGNFEVKQAEPINCGVEHLVSGRRACWAIQILKCCSIR